MSAKPKKPGQGLPFNIDDLTENTDYALDSLSMIAAEKIKAQEDIDFNRAIQDSTDAANRSAKYNENAIKSFESGEVDKGDADFQARITASGGWDAIYDSLTVLEKGELQDDDTNFSIHDNRTRGFMEPEDTMERPKHVVAGEIREEVQDVWRPEFDDYILNELNPIADSHYNRENPLLSIFNFETLGMDPSKANPELLKQDDLGFGGNPFSWDDPSKATHEYIKNEMGQDAYDSLLAMGEQKFLKSKSTKEKTFNTMEEWNKHELTTRRETEIEGLKSYSYRDKKNVLIPILEKMEAEAKAADLAANLSAKSKKVDPLNTTKSGASLQQTYEAQLDSIYQQSPQLKQALNQQGSGGLIEAYRNEGYAETGVSPEAFLKDQGLDY